VVLVSTDVYWQPIYHVLTETLEVLLSHAVRQQPGKRRTKLMPIGSPNSWLMD
jgi:hypothetical protein